MVNGDTQKRIPIIYIGTIYETAEYIVHDSRFQLKEVICEEDRISNEMYTFCLVRDIPLKKVKDKQSLNNALMTHGNKVIYLMFSFGIRIPMEGLKGYRIFNIHPAALPRYKGAQPTYWATVAGEKEIGISLVEIDEGLDTGKIISQVIHPYYLWENENDLIKVEKEVIPTFLDDIVTYIEKGEYFVKNSEGQYYKKVGRKEVYLDLESDSPAMIYNKMRAETAFGGIKIEIDGITYFLNHLWFEEKNINSLVEQIEDKLYIKYRKGISIVSKSFGVLKEPFKFRGEE